MVIPEGAQVHVVDDWGVTARVGATAEATPEDGAADAVAVAVAMLMGSHTVAANTISHTGATVHRGKPKTDDVASGAQRQPQPEQCQIDSTSPSTKSRHARKFTESKSPQIESRSSSMHQSCTPERSEGVPWPRPWPTPESERKRVVVEVANRTETSNTILHSENNLHEIKPDFDIIASPVHSQMEQSGRAVIDSVSHLEDIEAKRQNDDVGSQVQNQAVNALPSNSLQKHEVQPTNRRNDAQRSTHQNSEASVETSAQTAAASAESVKDATSKTIESEIVSDFWRLPINALDYSEDDSATLQMQGKLESLEEQPLLVPQMARPEPTEAHDTAASQMLTETMSLEKESTERIEAPNTAAVQVQTVAWQEKAAVHIPKHAGKTSLEEKPFVIAPRPRVPCIRIPEEAPAGVTMERRTSPREIRPSPREVPEDPENFAVQYGLDSRALRGLMSLSPEEQHVVMALVAHQPGSNPSATSWLKVKMAKEKPNRAKLEYLFISLDGPCLAALAALPSETQEAVAMKMGDPTRCRNISAFVWAEVKTKSSPRTPRPAELSVLPVIANEVAEAGGGPLDDRALVALSKLTPECRSWVLSQINPRTCRNPSAFVCAKIRSSGLQPGMPPPGGEGPQGTPRAPQGPAFSSQSPRTPSTLVPCAQEADTAGRRLASFLARYALDLLSSRALMELGGAEQEITMGLADWELRSNDGDPSLIVNSKVRLVLNDRDEAERQYLQVKQELDVLKRRSSEKNEAPLMGKGFKTYGTSQIACTASPQGRRAGQGVMVPPRRIGGA